MSGPYSPESDAPISRLVADGLSVVIVVKHPLYADSVDRFEHKFRYRPFSIMSSQPAVGWAVPQVSVFVMTSGLPAADWVPAIGPRVSS